MSQANAPPGVYPNEAAIAELRQLGRGKSRRYSEREMWVMVRERVCAIVIALTVCVPFAYAQTPRSTSTLPSAQSGSAETSWVQTGLGRVKAKVYVSARLNGHPVLIVVFHGDAPFSSPTYQYRFAQQTASQLSDVVVAAILRPGYSDGEDRSEGQKGMATGDNYTPEVIDAMAQVIAALKATYRANRVVLVGHSGGAAISADLLGRHPDVANAALLVSCPCDVPAWRSYMKGRKGGTIWDAPVTSLSPIDLVSTVSRSVQIHMMVGANDDVTPPRFSNEYATALRADGISVDVALAPKLPHDMLLNPVVFEALRHLVNQRSADEARSPRAN